jgi:hypothetical protein
VGLAIVPLGLLLLMGLLLPFCALAQPIALATVGTTLGSQNFASQTIHYDHKPKACDRSGSSASRLSKRTQLPLATLKLIEAEPKTWNDGCLGIATPEEICTQALVEGWRVVFSNANQRWIYGTHQQGQDMRLEG